MEKYEILQYGTSLMLTGKPFKVDLYEQTIRVGEQDLLKVCSLPHKISLEEALSNLESLYITYKHSRPKTDEPSRTYFKALRYNDLSNEDKDFGISRNVARFLLEATLLCYVLNGSLYWDEKVMGNGWFYKGKNDHDFIILRSWIEQNEN